MIMVKLTSKGQKSMFERAKNRKKFPGGVSPDPLAALVPSSLEEPPLTFLIFLRPWVNYKLVNEVVKSLVQFLFRSVAVLRPQGLPGSDIRQPCFS